MRDVVDDLVSNTQFLEQYTKMAVLSQHYDFNRTEHSAIAGFSLIIQHFRKWRL